MLTYGTFKDEPEQQHPVPRVPAPWKLQAESYILFMKLKELPEGIYDPREEEWGDEKAGKWTGGLGSVMVVRYSDTPVGPYDELLITPGTFTVPHPPNNTLKLPKSAQRISRIYVSQRTTAYNGRLNWNIPKHLARFSFSAPPTLEGQSPPHTLTVKVFPPGSKDGDGKTPFFACTLQPWKWMPSVPLNTRYVPYSMAAAQPPIPTAPGYEEARMEAEGAQVDEYDIDPKKAEAVLVGTKTWKAFDIAASTPRARGCWVEVHEQEGEEVEKWWPEGLEIWSVSAWFEDVRWVFGDVTEWEL